MTKAYEDQSPQPYERPVTLSALVVAWAGRDDLYARWQRELTDAEVNGVKAGRLREIGYLPPAERARAFSVVTGWWPPDHGEGLRGLAGWR